MSDSPPPPPPGKSGLSIPSIPTLSMDQNDPSVASGHSHSYGNGPSNPIHSNSGIAPIGRTSTTDIGRNASPSEGSGFLQAASDSDDDGPPPPRRVIQKPVYKTTSFPNQTQKRDFTQNTVGSTHDGTGVNHGGIGNDDVDDLPPPPGAQSRRPGRPYSSLRQPLVQRPHPVSNLPPPILSTAPTTPPTTTDNYPPPPPPPSGSDDENASAASEVMITRTLPGDDLQRVLQQQLMPAGSVGSAGSAPPTPLAAANPTSPYGQSLNRPAHLASLTLPDDNKAAGYPDEEEQPALLTTRNLQDSPAASSVRNLDIATPPVGSDESPQSPQRMQRVHPPPRFTPITPVNARASAGGLASPRILHPSVRFKQPQATAPSPSPDVSGPPQDDQTPHQPRFQQQQRMQSLQLQQPSRSNKFSPYTPKPTAGTGAAVGGSVYQTAGARSQYGQPMTPRSATGALPPVNQLELTSSTGSTDVDDPHRPKKQLQIRTHGAAYMFAAASATEDESSAVFGSKVAASSTSSSPMVTSHNRQWMPGPTDDFSSEVDDSTLYAAQNLRRDRYNVREKVDQLQDHYDRQHELNKGGFSQDLPEDDSDIELMMEGGVSLNPLNTANDTTYQQQEQQQQQQQLSSNIAAATGASTGHTVRLDKRKDGRFFKNLFTRGGGGSGARDLDGIPQDGHGSGEHHPSAPSGTFPVVSTVTQASLTVNHHEPSRMVYTVTKPSKLGRKKYYLYICRHRFKLYWIPLQDRIDLDKRHNLTHISNIRNGVRGCGSARCAYFVYQESAPIVASSEDLGCQCDRFCNVCERCSERYDAIHINQLCKVALTTGAGFGRNDCIAYFRDGSKTHWIFPNTLARNSFIAQCYYLLFASTHISAMQSRHVLHSAQTSSKLKNNIIDGDFLIFYNNRILDASSSSKPRLLKNNILDEHLVSQLPTTYDSTTTSGMTHSQSTVGGGAYDEDIEDNVIAMSGARHYQSPCITIRRSSSLYKLLTSLSLTNLNAYRKHYDYIKEISEVAMYSGGMLLNSLLEYIVASRIYDILGINIYDDYERLRSLPLIRDLPSYIGTFTPIIDHKTIISFIQRQLPFHSPKGIATTTLSPPEVTPQAYFTDDSDVESEPGIHRMSIFPTTPSSVQSPSAPSHHSASSTAQSPPPKSSVSGSPALSPTSMSNAELVTSVAALADQPDTHLLKTPLSTDAYEALRPPRKVAPVFGEPVALEAISTTPPQETKSISLSLGGASDSMVNLKSSRMLPSVRRRQEAMQKQMQTVSESDTHNALTPTTASDAGPATSSTLPLAPLSPDVIQPSASGAHSQQQPSRTHVGIQQQQETKPLKDLGYVDVPLSLAPPVFVPPALTIFCSTWNTGAKAQPKPDVLRSWLGSTNYSQVDGVRLQKQLHQRKYQPYLYNSEESLQSNANQGHGILLEESVVGAIGSDIIIIGFQENKLIDVWVTALKAFLNDPVQQQNAVSQTQNHINNYHAKLKQLPADKRDALMKKNHYVEDEIDTNLVLAGLFPDVSIVDVDAVSVGGGTTRQSKKGPASHSASKHNTKTADSSDDDSDDDDSDDDDDDDDDDDVDIDFLTALLTKQQQQEKENPALILGNTVAIRETKSKPSLSSLFGKVKKDGKSQDVTTNNNGTTGQDPSTGAPGANDPVSESSSGQFTPFDASNAASTGTPLYQYELLLSKSFWEMGICIFVKSHISHLVTDRYVETVATGFGNVIGNKGAVGVYLNVANTPMLIVSSHLEAREERLAQRNANYRRIIHELCAKLSPKLQLSVDLSNALVDCATSTTKAPAEPCSSTAASTIPLLDLLSATDVVIWLGDLNYRTICDFNDAVDYCKSNNLLPLASCDQLQYERLVWRSFLGFEEGPLSFTPTYRWMSGVTSFSNKRAQPPSWTDRVLFRRNHHDTLTLLSYGARHQTIVSDHRPVVSLFSFSPRGVDTSLSVPLAPGNEKERAYHHSTTLKQIRDLQVKYTSANGTILQACGCLGDCMCCEQFRLPVPPHEQEIDSTVTQVITTTNPVFDIEIHDLLLIPLSIVPCTKYVKPKKGGGASGVGKHGDTSQNTPDVKKKKSQSAASVATPSNLAIDDVTDLDGMSPQQQMLLQHSPIATTNITTTKTYVPLTQLSGVVDDDVNIIDEMALASSCSFDNISTPSGIALQTSNSLGMPSLANQAATAGHALQQQQQRGATPATSAAVVDTTGEYSAFPSAHALASPVSSSKTARETFFIQWDEHDNENTTLLPNPHTATTMRDISVYDSYDAVLNSPVAAETSPNRVTFTQNPIHSENEVMAMLGKEFYHPSPNGDGDRTTSQQLQQQQYPKKTRVLKDDDDVPPPPPPPPPIATAEGGLGSVGRAKPPVPPRNKSGGYPVVSITGPAAMVNTSTSLGAPQTSTLYLDGDELIPSTSNPSFPRGASSSSLASQQAIIRSVSSIHPTPKLNEPMSTTEITPSTIRSLTIEDILSILQLHSKNTTIPSAATISTLFPFFKAKPPSNNYTSKLSQFEGVRVVNQPFFNPAQLSSSKTRHISFIFTHAFSNRVGVSPPVVGSNHLVNGSIQTSNTTEIVGISRLIINLQRKIATLERQLAAIHQQKVNLLQELSSDDASSPTPGGGHGTTPAGTGTAGSTQASASPYQSVSGRFSLFSPRSSFHLPGFTPNQSNQASNANSAYNANATSANGGLTGPQASGGPSSAIASTNMPSSTNNKYNSLTPKQQQLQVQFQQIVNLLTVINKQIGDAQSELATLVKLHKTYSSPQNPIFQQTDTTTLSNIQPYSLHFYPVGAMAYVTTFTRDLLTLASTDIIVTVTGTVSSRELFGKKTQTDVIGYCRIPLNCAARAYAISASKPPKVEPMLLPVLNNQGSLVGLIKVGIRLKRNDSGDR